MAQWVHRVFLPWNYQEELKKVNERSAEGYHLVRASMFSKREEEDPGRAYRYALDCRQGKGGFTELLYEKQGWELCCRNGNFLWFRKPVEEGRQETEYEIHGEKRGAVEEELRRRIRPLDRLRNALLILAFLLVLVPGELTAGWTPRAACVPLFLCLLPVLAAEKMRKVLGEEKRK